MEFKGEDTSELLNLSVPFPYVIKVIAHPLETHTSPTNHLIWLSFYTVHSVYSKSISQSIGHSMFSPMQHIHVIFGTRFGQSKSSYSNHQGTSMFIRVVVALMLCEQDYCM